MAYTVSNDTPEDGCIQWSGLHMQYNGKSYAISDGYTNALYIYWTIQYPNNLVATNTYPTLGTDDCLVFLNKNGTAISIPGATSVDGSLIVPETILADALAANSVTADKIKAGAVTASAIAADAVGASAIAAGAVTAEQLAADSVTAAAVAADAIGAEAIAAGAVLADAIAAGAVTADKIKAYSVTADRLSIGTGGNLLYNYDTFEQITDTTLQWAKSSSLTATVATEDSYYGTRCLKLTNTGTNNATINLGHKENGYGCIPVQNGNVYIVSCWVKTGSSAKIWLGIVEHEAVDSTAKAYKYSAASTVGTSWTRIVFTYTATQSYPYVSIRIMVNGNAVPIYVDAIQVELVSNKAQTVSDFSAAGTTYFDGGNIYTNTITANQIKSGTITATQIAANTITAAKIATGTITATQIATNAITADRLAIGTGGNLYCTGYDTFEQITDDTISYAKSSSVSSCTIENSVTAYYGTKTLRIATTGADGYVYLGHSSNGYGCISVQAGKIYRVSCWAKSASGNISVQLYVVGHTSKNSTNSSSTGTSATVGTSWTRISMTYTASSSYPYTSIRIDNDTAGSTLYIDAIQIEIVSNASQEASDFKPASVTYINGGNILTQSITANQIAARTIDAKNIIANTITANEIKAGTITADKIAANTITADKIAANTITADKIAARTITATQIASNAITADKIAVDAIKSRNYVAGSAGSYLSLSTGAFDSPNLKWTSAGVVTMTKGKIGDLTLGDGYITSVNASANKRLIFRNVQDTETNGILYFDDYSSGSHVYPWRFNGDGSFQLGSICSIDGASGKNMDVRIKDSALFVDYGLELFGVNDTGQPYIDFHFKEKMTSASDYTNRIMAESARILSFLPSSSTTKRFQVLFESGTNGRLVIRPDTNGGGYIGTTSYRWNTGFFTNTITQSDSKTKNILGSIEKSVEFIKNLNPVLYTLKNGDSGQKRRHMGFIAQEVAKTVKDLEMGDLALYQASKINEDGTEEHYKEGTPDEQLSWGLNYNEIIAPLVSTVQYLLKQVEELKRIERQ